MNGAEDRPRVRVQRGLYADELRVGDEFVHAPGRTLTETDNVLFTTLTMNPQALHLDHDYAAKQPLGNTLVNSMLTLSTMVGLSVPQLTQGTLVAQLGLGEIRFPAPLFPGDTLSVRSRVLSMRASGSRPGQWIVEFEHEGRKQDGTLVASAVRTVLLWEEAAHLAHLAGERPA